MKAVVCRKYGPPDLLRLEDVPQPVPKDGQVLIQVQASSVTFSNLGLVSGKPFIMRFFGFGIIKPKIHIPGSDVAGRVAAVGAGVKKFKPGDEVYGDISGEGRGCFAEFAVAPEAALALKPANVSFAEAAAVPESGLVALQAVRDAGKIQKGQSVLIYGASGGIGTFAVQIARHYGAEVTGVCGPKNLEFVRSLGADRVIDYTREDFSRSGRRYDLIVATVGSRSIFAYKRALAPRGIYVNTGGTMPQVFQALLLGPLISRKRGKKLSSMLVKPNKDLDFMRELIEAGRVKPVIDKSFPLSEAAEAFRYYATRRARGKVVVTVT